jgi:hypothetical protein
MKSLLALLCLLLPLLAIPAHATDITVACTAPTKFTDGTPITGPVTYNLYGALQGQPKKLLAPSPLTTCSSVRSNVNAGTQCYEATALVPGYGESDHTSESCVTITAEPTCPAQPAPQTRTQACIAPLVGSWSQTLTYTSVAAPACWQPGAWLPTQAPEGVCAPPVLVTADQRAYAYRGTTLPMALRRHGRRGCSLRSADADRERVRYCHITKAQVDMVVWPNDLALTDFWAKVGP